MLFEPKLSKKQKKPQSALLVWRIQKLYKNLWTDVYLLYDYLWDTFYIISHDFGQLSSKKTDIDFFGRKVSFLYQNECIMASTAVQKYVNMRWQIML
jgi:hypothetical protein